MQNNSTNRLKLMFVLMRSVVISPEMAKEVMKQKVIEEVMERVQPVCKNEKDIRLMKGYLQGFSGFLAAYSYTQEGQKIILVFIPPI